MSHSLHEPHEVDWNRILAAGPYPIEAYAFVRDGLAYTLQQIRECPESLPESQRHISGQELCMGLRQLAIQRYGMLAPLVMEHWNVRRTADFGRIVFAMIDAGLMTKTASDSIEDFYCVFDFDEGFSREALLANLASALLSQAADS
jgi:uncharacterized repeat protein (TIGR04138 family)